MDTFELKREQLKLAPKVVLTDNFTRVKTVGGAVTLAVKNNLLGCVVVCEYPSFKVLESQTYLLSDPLPYQSELSAYREMPAIIEAYNKLEQEPDVLFVSGQGIAHSRRLGLASHLGLALNQSTIGVTTQIKVGRLEQGKIIFRNEIAGFEIKTRNYANPIYVSPGHLISLGSTLRLVQETIKFPHKMPEPLHIARKIAKKAVEKIAEKEINSCQDECISKEKTMLPSC